MCLHLSLPRSPSLSMFLSSFTSLLRLSIRRRSFRTLSRSSSSLSISDLHNRGATNICIRTLSRSSSSLSISDLHNRGATNICIGTLSHSSSSLYISDLPNRGATHICSTSTGAIQELHNAFSGNLTPLPPRNANNVELQIFVINATLQ